MAKRRSLCERLCADTIPLFKDEHVLYQLSPAEWARLLTEPWYQLPTLMPQMFAGKQLLPDQETFETLILMFHIGLIGKGRIFPE